MQRHGECNNCGWCCQFEAVRKNTVLPPDGQATLDDDTVKFYTLRGGTVHPSRQALRYTTHEHAPCSAHDICSKQCTIYKERPQVCVEFPQTPGQIEGTPCSYWFEYVQDGKTVRRGGEGSPYPSPPNFDE